MTEQSLPAAGETVRTTFEWGRIQSNSDWILPVVACVAILLFVRWMYRRDSVELHPVVGLLLTALRTATFFGLLIMFLQPHWRSEREVGAELTRAVAGRYQSEHGPERWPLGGGRPGVNPFR